MSNSSLSVTELDRYARHLSLKQVGIAGQLRLKASRVLLIGAGGLGSPAAAYLAAAGVGYLTIADGDVVEVSNLQRQILYEAHDVGAKKAVVAVARLERANPEITIKCYPHFIGEDNVNDLVSEHDIVIDGSDSFTTRYLVNDSCVAYGKPLIFGSVLKFQGQVTLLNYMDGPCLRCIFPTQPDSRHLPSCSETGVIGVVPSTIASIQVTEALKVLLGIGNTLSGRLVAVDSLGMRFSELALVRNDNCICCANRSTEAATEIIASYRSRDLDMSRQPLSKSPAELKHLLADEFGMHVIDVRSAEEHSFSAIPTSKNIPLLELQTSDLELGKQEVIVVYCQSGTRSAIAQQTLISQGFTNVFDLQGGMERWTEMG